VSSPPPRALSPPFSATCPISFSLFYGSAIINWHKEGPEEREKGPEETHGMKPKAQRSKMKSKLNPT